MICALSQEGDVFLFPPVLPQVEGFLLVIVIGKPSGHNPLSVWVDERSDWRRRDARFRFRCQDRLPSDLSVDQRLEEAREGARLDARLPSVAGSQPPVEPGGLLSQM